MAQSAAIPLLDIRPPVSGLGTDSTSYLDGREILTISGVAVKDVDHSSWRWHTPRSDHSSDQPRTYGNSVSRKKVADMFRTGVVLSVECYSQGKLDITTIPNGMNTYPRDAKNRMCTLLAEGKYRWLVVLGPKE